MKRNIVIISIDSLRADGVNHNRELINGKNNFEPVVTSNLDDFCQRGVSFTRAYSTNTYTSSAHASLFTGCYPPEHSIRSFFDFNQKLNSKTPTLAEMLSKMGYETFFYSDVKELFSEMDIWRGFKHKTYGKSDWLWTTLDEHRADRNFIFIHLFDVHEPYLFIEDNSSHIKNNDYHQVINELRNELGLKSNLNPKTKPHESWEEIRLFLQNNELDHQEYLEKFYLQGVEKFDQQRLPYFFEKLSQLGIDVDEDLVILLSDHGEGRTEFVNAKSFAHGGSLTEETVRIFLAFNQDIGINPENLISLKNLQKITLAIATGEQVQLNNTSLYAEHFQWNQRTTLQDSEEDKLATNNIANIQSFLSEQVYITPEYKLRFIISPHKMNELINNNLTDEEFVDKAYNILLNRFTDEDGKKYHLELLKTNSRGEILDLIMNSIEYHLNQVFIRYEIHQLQDRAI